MSVTTRSAGWCEHVELQDRMWLIRLKFSQDRCRLDDWKFEVEIGSLGHA